MIPDEELRYGKSLNLAPMVDFLFLILAVFAVLTVSRSSLYDTEVSLVKMEGRTPPPSVASNDKGHTVLLSINSNGHYKWVTEFNEFLLDGVEGIKEELVKQERLGHLSKDRANTRVLLHIDKEANWESIAKVIFSVREKGYQINPVYCPE